jgi:hypothetical protein
MYALKPSPHRNSQPARQPAKPRRRVKPKVKLQRKSAPHRVIAYETTAKLAVNFTLSMAAIVALVQLLPYHSSQDVKLQELQAAVKLTGDRVQRVQSKFNNYFDPSQARENMQELTDRIDPSRRQIVWQTPAAPVSPQGTAQNPVQEKVAGN